MHCLTNQGSWELRIDYQLSNGTRSYLHYRQFAIGPAEDQYRLNISGFDSVGLTDPFVSDHPLTGMKFSSRDLDNDLSTGNCAHGDGGGWLRSCTYIRLDSAYNYGRTVVLNGQWHALPFMEIKIRLLNCSSN